MVAAAKFVDGPKPFSGTRLLVDKMRKNPTSGFGEANEIVTVLISDFKDGCSSAIFGDGPVSLLG